MEENAQNRSRDSKGDVVLGYFVAFIAVSFLSILVFAIFVIFTVSLVFWVAFGVVFAGPSGLRPHDTRRHRLRCCKSWYERPVACSLTFVSCLDKPAQFARHRRHESLVVDGMGNPVLLNLMFSSRFPI